MQPEGGKINTLHLGFLITGFTFGSSVILSPGVEAGHNAWLTVFAGLVMGLIMAYIYFTVAEKFPGKNFIEINDLLLGAYLGKIVFLLYLCYFLHLGSLILRDFGDFFTLTIYVNTPEVVIVGSFALLAASAVRNGIEVITRCSLIIVPLTMFAFILDTILILPQAKYEKLLPILELPLKDFLRISFSSFSFPFGEVVCFLMITAFLNSTKGLKKHVLSGLTVAGFFLITASIRNTTVLGAAVKMGLYPTFDAIQLIDIADFLTRLELVIISVMLTTGFIKLSVLYYGTVIGLAQVFKLRSYLPLVLPIGIILVVLCITQFENTQENLAWAANIYPWYVLPFQVLFPFLYLILALLKGNHSGRKKAGERS